METTRKKSSIINIIIIGKDNQAFKRLEKIIESARHPAHIASAEDEKTLIRSINTFKPDLIIQLGKGGTNAEQADWPAILNKHASHASYIVLKDDHAIQNADAFIKLFLEKKQTNGKAESFQPWDEIDIDKKLHLILNNITDVVTITDINGRFLYNSLNNKQQSGYDPEENIGKNGFDLVHPEDIKRVKETHLKILRNPGKTYTLTYRHLNKAGNWYWLETRGKLVKKKNEEPFIILCSRDVTYRKNAEEDIRKLSLAIEQNPSSVIITNTKGEIEYVNPQLLRKTGYKKNELIGKNPRIFKSGKMGEKVYRELWKTLSSGLPWHGELYNKKKDGSMFWEHAWILPVKNEMDQITNYLAIKEDITEQKRSQLYTQISYNIASLSNKNQNTLNELLGMIHLEINKVINTDNFYIALYDEDKDTYSFPYFIDHKSKINPAHLEMQQSMTDYVRRTGEARFLNRKKQKKLLQSGKIVQVGASAKVWLGIPLKANGRTIGVMAVQSYENEQAFDQRDFDFLKYVSGQIANSIEKQRMQDALIQSEKLYRSLTEFSSDITLVLDKKGDIRYISQSVNRIFGLNKERLLGRNVFILMHRDDVSRAKKIFSGWKKADDPRNRATFRFRRADGTWRYIEAGVTNHLDDPLIKGLIVNALDVTERYIAEQNLIKATNTLKFLHEFDRTIQNAQSIQEIADCALTKMQQMNLPFDRSSVVIFEYEDAVARFLSVDVKHKKSQIYPGQTIPIDAFGHIDKLKKGQYHIVDNLGESSPISMSDQILIEEGYQSYMVCPLISKKHLIGAMMLDSLNASTISKDDMYIIVQIASQLSLAILESRARTGLIESEKLMRVIYEQAPVGIARLDTKGRFMMVNQKLSEIFGYSHKRLLNSTLLDITHPEDISILKDMQERFMGGNIKRNYQFSKRYIHKKGDIIFVNALFSFIDQGTDAGYYIAVFEDITKRIKMQERLESANKELNTFVYKASHDLKGPLASIAGLSTLGLSKTEDKASHQIFEMIKKSTERLDKTLSDLLEISRSTNTTIHLQEIDIEDLILEMLESIEYADYNKEIEIKRINHLKRKIFSDRDMLISVLQNLTVNALKYHNPDESNKWIKIISEESDSPPGIHISVEDNGLGIEEDMQEKVFDMFFRGNDHSEGTGLGLYIVKKNIDKLGGYITLSKRRGGGSVFKIFLPN